MRFVYDKYNLQVDCFITILIQIGNFKYLKKFSFANSNFETEYTIDTKYKTFHKKDY